MTSIAPQFDGFFAATLKKLVEGAQYSARETRALIYIFIRIELGQYSTSCLKSGAD